jgi:hypothetical protein
MLFNHATRPAYLGVWIAICDLLSSSTIVGLESKYVIAVIDTSVTKR